MGLMNYTTKVPAEKTVAEIIKSLVNHGGRRVIMDYDPDTHELVAVAWRVTTKNGDLPFRLPANVPAVERTLREQHRSRQVDANAVHEGQAARVAWRIVKNWVEAQMAILETGMVEFEEIFLPYMLTGSEETLYQMMIDRGFKALNPGQEDDQKI